MNGDDLPIRCPCGRQFAATAVAGPSITPDAIARAVRSVAGRMGWLELDPGSWCCPGCARTTRRMAESGALS